MTNQYKGPELPDDMYLTIPFLELMELSGLDSEVDLVNTGLALLEFYYKSIKDGYIPGLLDIDKDSFFPISLEGTLDEE